MNKVEKFILKNWLHQNIFQKNALQKVENACGTIRYRRMSNSERENTNPSQHTVKRIWTFQQKKKKQTVFRRKTSNLITKHQILNSISNCRHCPCQCEDLFTHPTLSGLLCALVYPKPSVVDTDLVQCLVCEQGDFQNTAGETPERIISQLL